MCRKEALKVSSHLDEFKEAGASRIVGLVKEDIPNEVDDFRKDYWKGEVHMDRDMAFYKALGGGEVYQPFGLASFVAMLANPFSKSKTRQNSLNIPKEIEKNTIGEGFISGGSFVLTKDGTPVFSFLETDYGEHAEVQDLLDALKKASRE
mmetsp:Transcript_53129/g.95333  ORF Transcript_53129/g.95333 Transcript_53129/m.95333 type:complete len:150 (+) Transcript_53129:179-628(+)